MYLNIWQESNVVQPSCREPLLPPICIHPAATSGEFTAVRSKTRRFHIRLHWQIRKLSTKTECIYPLGFWEKNVLANDPIIYYSNVVLELNIQCFIYYLITWTQTVHWCLSKRRTSSALYGRMKSMNKKKIYIFFFLCKFIFLFGYFVQGKSLI